MQKLQENKLVHLTDSMFRILAQNRITTILDFLQEDSEKLSTLTKLSLPQILDIRNDILAKYSAPLVTGSSVMLKNAKKRKYISTGIASFDSVSGGGIATNHLTEICGLAGSGKTQLCLQIAINCVRDSDETVLYVDTKGDFSATRIQKILDASGCSYKEMAKIMLKIKLVHVWSMDEILELFKNLKNKLLPIEKLSLIIVDSLPSLMFQYLGDDNKVGLKFLNMLVNYSRYISKELNIGIIFVNIQTRWLEQDIFDGEDDGEQSTSRDNHSEKRNRCLGKYWHYIPAFLIIVEKMQTIQERNTKIGVTVTKAFGMACEEKCELTISHLGVN